ncbi:NUDIX hydrolase [Zavarzinia aquatilis]|uniref:NUDIX hydrolase n=1 Tax=Zavarzinia aquatilis TaxID=2211142 RepID=A0A317EGB9_9PROT|nr:NUDIX hydrolase [Zavarzinia aquatilis]PWR25130.1 NUDIX hydrolase [Zavarzinia aquatilis]
MMRGTALTGPLAVRGDAAPPDPPRAALDRVAAIWQAEKARRGDALFDGRLFSIRTLAPGLITGWLAPYSWYVAQRRDAALAAALDIRPLGVTGIMICDDGIVLGRRGGGVETDAGLWELAPSGGVDGEFRTGDGSLDLGAQLLNELVEETGLPAALATAPPRPVALAEDGESGITDVGLLLRIACDAAAVRAAFAPLAGQEYAELAVVPRDALGAFMAGRAAQFGRVSRCLIETLGLTAP